jgi:hypothetical protein
MAEIYINFMKVKNLNITLEWNTINSLYNFTESNTDIEAKFPSHDVTVRNENGTILFKKLNSNEYINIIERNFDDNGPEPCMKTKLNVGVSKSTVKSIFKYNFSDNYLKYKELNNKIGFFKKLLFSVDYDNDGKADFTEEAEYAEIENLNKNALFNKIYRSSDYLTLKLIINKEYFKEKEIYSLLVLSEASNKLVKNKKLTSLFTKEVEKKWLDVNESTGLLTIPFIESDIVEISENLNIKIIPMNYLQSEMYDFLKSKESQNDIDDLYEGYFYNQMFNIGKIYKQSVNNETVAFYQNYLYLFNNQSLNLNSLTSNLLINDMTFNSYFPLLNKDQTNKTICLSNDLNTDDVLDNNYNLQKGYLGFYGKDSSSYEDIAIDLDYLQNQGILQAKIIEIEENSDTYNIYIEFITTFCNDEKFYIETSSNLKYTEKYKTNIDNKDYITLLFKYSYDSQSLNEYLNENASINKSQIISDKDLINFSAKLIL